MLVEINAIDSTHSIDFLLEATRRMIFEDFAPILYKLNLHEINPHIETNYELREKKRIQYSNLRTSLECYLLENISSLNNLKHMTIPSIEDKDGLYNFLINYARNRIDNRYVEW